MHKEAVCNLKQQCRNGGRSTSKNAFTASQAATTWRKDGPSCSSMGRKMRKPYAPQLRARLFIFFNPGGSDALPYENSFHRRIRAVALALAARPNAATTSSSRLPGQVDEDCTQLWKRGSESSSSSRCIPLHVSFCTCPKGKKKSRRVQDSLNRRTCCQQSAEANGYLEEGCHS
eukprot:5041546-Amphidinium_carterae.1